MQTVRSDTEEVIGRMCVVCFISSCGCYSSKTSTNHNRMNVFSVINQESLRNNKFSTSRLLTHHPNLRRALGTIWTLVWYSLAESVSLISSLNHIDIEKMDQVSILQSELELIKFRLVELKDSKQNLEAHPNKSAMEIASIEELQNEIAQQEEQFCLVDEEMKQVKHTVKYELEKKAMIVKSTRDQIEDMLAQLKS